MNKFKTIKKWHAALLLIIMVSFLFVYFRSKEWPVTTMFLGERRIEVIVADTYTKQYQGLSNRDTLVPHDAMLFPFGYAGLHTMVMRDMRFPLDFIWLQGVTVVDITLNAAPEPSRKEADLTRYSPIVPATSVLEVSAGTVAKWGLKIGDSFMVYK